VIFGVEGVKDVQLFRIEGVKDVQFIDLDDEIKASSGEKIVLQGEHPVVEIADSPVFVDVRIQVLRIPPTPAKDTIEKYLKDQTVKFIDKLIKEREKVILFNDFMRALKGNDYEIKSLAFDIEYSESGMIKRDITQGSEKISENEAFVLRSPVKITFEN
jgi:hypothetical protein